MSFLFKCLCAGVILAMVTSCASGSKAGKKEKALTQEEHFLLALKATERGNLEEAVTEYQQVLKIDPKCARAYVNLGIVYGRQGRSSEEVSSYKKAVAIDPKLAEAYFHLGVAYYELKAR